MRFLPFLLNPLGCHWIQCVLRPFRPCPVTIIIPKGKHRNQGTSSNQTPEDNPCELHLSPEHKGITTSELPAVIEDNDTSIIVDEED